MKKILLALVVLFLFAGCSATVPKDDYDKLNDQLNLLQNEYDQQLRSNKELLEKIQSLQVEKELLQSDYAEAVAEIQEKTESSNAQKQENIVDEKTDSSRQPTKEQTAPQKPNLTNWTPYHTSDLKTLAENIAKGYVVYYNEQYWASPEFVEMLKNEEVVYENDISPDAEKVDRFAFAGE